MAQGNHGFRWQQVEWGPVLVCEPLLAIAPHLFTTRALNVGEDRAPAYARVARALGLAGRLQIGEANQVHGVEVAVFDGQTHAARPPQAADVLVTADPDRAVVVRVADCVPILLGDRHRAVVAAVHAGWRGTCLGAATAAVRAMTVRFGSRPEDLVAAVGPSIGPCCYQVGPEVRAAFAARDTTGVDVDGWFTPDAGRWRLDLWKANRDQLVAAGVAAAAIHMAGECTASAVDRYFSFRVEGARAGRLLAAIRPAPFRAASTEPPSSPARVGRVE